MIVNNSLVSHHMKDIMYFNFLFSRTFGGFQLLTVTNKTDENPYTDFLTHL